MEASDPTHELSHSCSKLFLALAMIKSKPVDSNLKDYIEQFRECVFLEVSEHGSAAQAKTTKIAHWKRMHAESVELAAKLKERLNALENQQQVQTNVATTQTTPNAANSGKTRKRYETTKSSAAHQARDLAERSQSLAYVLQDEKHIENILDELHIKTASSDVHTYLDHLYTLLKQLSQSNQDTTDLTSSIIQLSLDACVIIHKGVMDSSNNEGLVGVQLIKRSVCHIVKACAHVENEENHARFDEIVFHITQFFQHLLNAISDVASEQQDSLHSSTSREADIDSPGNAVYRLCSELSSTAVLMVVELCSIGSELDDMINGCLHILLSRVGHLLSTSLFKEPAGLHSEKHSTPEPSQVEVQSLMWVLEKITATLRRNRSQEYSNNGEPCSSDPSAHVLGHQNGRLLQFQRAMQDTLLYTMFADENLLTNRLLPVPIVDERPSLVHGDRPKQNSRSLESEIWRLLCMDALYGDRDMTDVCRV